MRTGGTEALLIDFGGVLTVRSRLHWRAPLYRAGRLRARLRREPPEQRKPAPHRHRPCEPILALLRELRARAIPVGLISDATIPAVPWVRDSLPPGLFDAIVLSGEVGLSKPDPAIYRLAAERLGVPPAACLYVENRAELLGGARATGMRTILHTDPGLTVTAVRDALGLDAPAFSPGSERAGASA